VHDEREEKSKGKVCHVATTLEFIFKVKKAVGSPYHHSGIKHDPMN